MRCVPIILACGVLSLALLRADSVPTALREVVIVFKTHFDLGYTDMASNVVRRYQTTMIDQALAVVDQNRNLPPDRQFVWTIPGWPLSRILQAGPAQSSERRQRVEQAFRQGRFVVHALPFSTHTELLEAEDLVRGLGFSSQLSRAAGLALPRDAKMTDVPCHSWVLPTLLRRAGVDFLHLGCNAASSSPQVPVLFWWEGPDRSRLLTMYTAESYGTGLVPPPDWPYDTWLALIHTGDNHGPPTPDEVRQLLDEAKRKLPNVRVRIGRLSDFADALLAEKALLPVVRGDMPDTWIHGPMCDPAGARLARNTRPRICAAEALDTELRLWRVAVPVPVAEAAATVRAAWEQSLLYGEHTWGGALYWVARYSAEQRLPYGENWRALHLQGKYERLESSWVEHSSYIEQAQALAQPLLDERLRALANSVGHRGRRVVVFNPLPWTRDGVVTMDRETLPIPALRPAEGGRAIPVEALGAEVRFVASQVPAFCYRTYAVVADGVPLPGKSLSPAGAALVRANGILENRFFVATVSPEQGTLRSLIDKRSGRELVDPAAPHGLGQYLYERFSADEVSAYVKAYVKISADWATNELGKPNLPPARDVPYVARSPRRFTLRAEQGAEAATAIMTAVPADGLPGVTTRVVLYQDQPYLDLEVTLHDKPADPWPEAGWLCLPFAINSPRFRLGRLGGIIDPTRDIVPGANRHMLGVNTGVLITDPQGGGVGLCALDNPLISLDAPGCWKYAKDFVPRRPAVYLNLFNNQWTTNFRLWNSGTWTARVRLWAVASRQDTTAALIAPSLEARYCLLAAVADGAPGPLPASRTGLTVEGKNALVTAFGPNPDGPGTILRLWEHAGRSGNLRVHLPPGMRAAQVIPVDLRGQRAGRPVAVRAGTFKVGLEAFAPASFVIGE